MSDPVPVIVPFGDSNTGTVTFAFDAATISAVVTALLGEKDSAKTWIQGQVDLVLGYWAKAITGNDAKEALEKILKALTDRLELTFSASGGCDSQDKADIVYVPPPASNGMTGVPGVTLEHSDPTAVGDLHKGECECEGDDKGTYWYRNFQVTWTATIKIGGFEFKYSPISKLLVETDCCCGTVETELVPIPRRKVAPKPKPKPKPARKTKKSVKKTRSLSRPLKGLAHHKGAAGVKAQTKTRVAPRGRKKASPRKVFG